MDAGDVELLRRMETDLQRAIGDVRSALALHDHPHTHEAPAAEEPPTEPEVPAGDLEELGEPDELPESDVVPAAPAADDQEPAPVRIHPLHARLW